MQSAQITDFARQGENLIATFENNRDNDERLVEIRARLDALAKSVLQSAVEFRPRMVAINSRLDQLGAPPAEGAPPEPQPVTEERNRLINEKAEINALIGEAENLSLKINSTIQQIADRRRELFAQSLWKRYDIHPDAMRQAAGHFADEVSELWRRSSSWVRFVARFKSNQLLIATFFTVLVAAFLLIGSRRIAQRIRRAPEDGEPPTFLERILVAFWATFLPTLLLGAGAYLTMFLFYEYRLFRQDLGTIILSIVNVALVIFLVHRLAMLIMAPWKPAWRLVEIRQPAAKRLYWLAVATAAVTGIDVIMLTINEVLGSPLGLTVVKSLVATVVVAVLVLAIAAAKPFVDESGEPRSWPTFVRFMLFAIGLVPLGATAAGYVGLARFVLQQIVVTGAIVVTMYVGFIAAREIAAENALMQSAAGKRLQKRFGWSGRAIEQIGVVSGIATYALVLLLGIPLILLQWGFRWADIRTWAVEVLDGFQVGSITISIYGILAGIAIFAVAYILTRWFQRWLDGTVMARARMDSGVRNSIRTAVGYVGFVIALLIGISAAGIELQNIALVAGGLSLGIGFGLQNVVSNFVSGLILLAERPFKAGDWIETGSVSGFVKKISVRATEIETFQRQTVILPNSDLINAAVGNWTHRNRLARIDIPVGVAYGSDAKRVRDILAEVAGNHSKVLKNPEPVVVFRNFGDSSLDFELRVFLHDVFDMNEVQTDIRFAILDAFAAENIEIPFPQRDINLKTGETAAAVTTRPAVRKSGTRRGSARKKNP